MFLSVLSSSRSSVCLALSLIPRVPGPPPLPPFISPIVSLFAPPAPIPSTTVGALSCSHCPPARRVQGRGESVADVLHLAEPGGLQPRPRLPLQLRLQLRPGPPRRRRRRRLAAFEHSKPTRPAACGSSPSIAPPSASSRRGERLRQRGGLGQIRHR